MSTNHPYNQFLNKLVHISAGPLNTFGRVEQIDWDNNLMELSVAVVTSEGTSYIKSYITISSISIITQEPEPTND